MFTPTVSEILMSEGRSVLSPPQRDTESEGIKLSLDRTLNLCVLNNHTFRYKKKKIYATYLV